ncbi:cysteine hydrolase family protein [Chloroflexota bacterium]
MLKTLKEKVDPKHAALLVVDVQNDVCHSDGLIAQRGGDVSAVQRMVPRLLRFILQARKAKVPIIFIRHSANQGTMSQVRLEILTKHNMPVDRFGEQEGTWGAEFYRVKPQPGDSVVTKHRYNAFIDSDLDLVLRSQGIKTVIMTGVSRNCCVAYTAIDASMRDYYVVFARDGTASFKPARTSVRNHRIDDDTTLRTIEARFGSVVNYREVVEAWQR